MKSRKKLNKVRERRARRVRAVVKGTGERPRLSVFRSHSQIYAQLIDDQIQKTLVSASSQSLKTKMKNTEKAKKVGELLAENAKKAGIKIVVLDRGKYRYHGRVKALAEGARAGGLIF